MKDVLTLLFLGFVIVSVAGFVLDRPLFMSYVLSDSMSPTLNKGDIFFINPLSKGDVGDIIVFKMNGHWTVHRIYAKTEDGYITKGDNNIATDQQSGNVKPVKDEDIAGVVLTINGKPLKIPGVGNYIGANPYLAILLIIIGSILMTKDKKKRRKGRFIRVRYKTLYAIVASFTIAVVLFSIVASWYVVGFGYISTLAGGQREGWYLPNSEFSRNLTVKNRALLPAVVTLKPVGDRISLDRHILILMGREKGSVGVHVNVPGDTRMYYEKVLVRSYPLLLPSNLIIRMSEISPYLPLMAFGGELGVILLILYRFTGDDEVLRIRRRFV